MNKPAEVYQQYLDVATIEEVARVFENVASIEVRQIKDRVLASRDFFHELWSMYVQLRLDSGKAEDFVANRPTNSKTAVILISSDESLGGNIDEKLIEETLSETSPEQVDYFVIGKRGALILKTQGIEPKAVYPLPDITKPVNVIPIISQTQMYKTTVVYFEQFISLANQQVQVFELVAGIKKLSEAENARTDTTLIFSSDYIFEPSLEVVISYLESMMRATALTELILESRLAQLASRFNAMNRAGTNAGQQKKILYTQYRRRKRQQDYAELQTFRQGKVGIL